MEVLANGKTFTIQDGSSKSDIETMIDHYFSTISVGDVPSPTEVGRPASEIIAARPGVFDFVTGESKMTPDMTTLEEIGNAPELSQLSGASFKSSLAPMVTGDTGDLKAILKSQWGDQVDFRDDEKGNTIVKFPSGEYALNKPGFTAQDTARGLLELLTFGKGAAMAQGGKSWLRKAGKQALAAGAVETGNEVLDTSLGGTFDPVDVGVATGFGGGGQILGDSVGAIYRRFKDMIPLKKADQYSPDFFDPAIPGAPRQGTPIDQVRNDTSAANSIPKVFQQGTPEEIVSAGNQFNITPMTSDVNQPQNFVSRSLEDLTGKIPFLGTSGARQGQQLAREGAVDNIINRYGEYSDEAIIASLKSGQRDAKDIAGEILGDVSREVDTAVGNRFGREGIPVNRLISGIDDLVEELTIPGVLPDTNAADKLIELRSILSDSPQTFTSLRANRTRFREIVNQIDPASKSQMGSNAKRLLNGVNKEISDGLDRIVQELSPENWEIWKEGNAAYRELADDFTKTRLKNILDKGEMTPEVYKGMLFSKKVSEVKKLRDNLTIDGQENARNAIIGKIVDTLDNRAGEMTPDAFVTELKKNRKAIDVFFQGDDRRAIDGLFKILNATKGAQSASLRTPTGQAMLLPTAAIGGFMLPSSATLPFISAIFSRKLYNNPKVRDILIRINKSDKGRPTEALMKKLLEATETVINVGQLTGQPVQGSQLEN